MFHVKHPPIQVLSSILGALFDKSMTVRRYQLDRKLFQQCLGISLCLPFYSYNRLVSIVFDADGYGLTLVEYTGKYA